MITGFGKLSENPLSLGHKDLRLHTHLAELVDLENHPGSRTQFTGKLQSTYLPVGEIARLPLHTILRDGRTLFQKHPALPSEYKESRNLNFSRSNITVFDRFGFDGKGNRIIPVPARWANQLQDPEMHGLFIGIGSSSDPYSIIIPTIEIFRFFYATSDVMAKALLRDDFLDPERNIWNPKKTALSSTDGKALLWLRKRMLDADARFIARFAFDKYALHQAQQIFLYACNLAQHPHGERYIRAIPPIDNEVFTTYHCRLINTATDHRILVTRLLQCSWQPPFTSLKWDRDNDGRYDPDNREERDPVHWNPTFHVPKPTAEDIDPAPTRLANEPPSTICAPSRLKEFEITERFPDLGAIPAEKLPQDNTKTKTSPDWRPIMEEAFAGTVIDGKSSEELIGPTIIEGLEKKPPPSKELTDAVDANFGVSNYLTILNLLKEIKKNNLAKVEFKTVLNSQALEHDVVFNVYPEELDGKQKSWLYVDKNKTKRRMVLLAEITTEGKTRYLIELQQKATSQSSTLVVWQPKEIRLAPGLLAQLLLDCARNGSTTIGNAHLLRVNWSRLRHTTQEITLESSTHFLARTYNAQPINDGGIDKTQFGEE